MRDRVLSWLIVVGIMIFGFETFYLGKQFAMRGVYGPSEVAGVEVDGVEIDMAKYSLESMAANELLPGKIEVDYSNNEFRFEFDPGMNSGELKTTTGAIQAPKGVGPFPLVVLVRGYVDKEVYRTGMGTSSVAEVFRENGYVTVAPDFLGYGGSDGESLSVLETRFQTYTTLMSLVLSLDQIPEWDGENVYIWAHSNGGQITLTALAVMQEPIPTTLWAPVTRYFPYNILYYTNELVDEGWFIRRELAQFEKEYDVAEYSFTTYLRGIVAPIQIHQGTDDAAVPWNWSTEFATELANAGVEHELFMYNADHNMRPAWDKAVQRDLEFFEANLKD